MLPDIATIIDNFSILDEGPDRYEYLIELGRALPPFPEALLTEENRVHGCES
jgi:cysteine desulfuration protein SufE